MQFGGEYEGLNLGEIDSPTDEDIRLPEDVSTIRGIHCQIPNQYADYLNRIFNGVDLSGFTWQICQGEFLFFDNTENRLRKDFFPDPLLSGDRFLECIARPEYYMVFACIQAYPSGSSDSGIEDPVTLDSSPYIQTYEDFLSSQYQVILLCTDSVHIDIYLKDTALMNMAERIFKYCVQSGFHNIAYITHDSDYVIRREEQ